MPIRRYPARTLYAKRDKAILPLVQQHVAEQAGIMEVVKLPRSHSTFLARPDEAVSIIDSVVRNKGDPHA